VKPAAPYLLRHESYWRWNDMYTARMEKKQKEKEKKKK
jgi:hypothetical protein